MKLAYVCDRYFCLTFIMLLHYLLKFENSK